MSMFPAMSDNNKRIESRGRNIAEVGKSNRRRLLDSVEQPLPMASFPGRPRFIDKAASLGV